MIKTIPIVDLDDCLFLQRVATQRKTFTWYGNKYRFLHTEPLKNIKSVENYAKYMLLMLRPAESVFTIPLEHSCAVFVNTA